MNALILSPDTLFNTALLMAMAVVAAIAWFFANRASVRVSEQIQLLHSLLDEQKKQNVLLRQLLEQQQGESEQDTGAQRDLIRVIPER